MSTLRDYLVQKRDAIRTIRENRTTDPEPLRPAATVSIEGRSGIRRIRIRDFQLLSDATPALAGYNLGPGAAEMQMGVLGACLTHLVLIVAADMEIPLDAVDVDVWADQDAESKVPGYDHVPGVPHDIGYTLRIASPASAGTIATLHQAVEAVCPVLNLLANPQTITGTVELNGTAVSTLTAGASTDPLTTA
jgi:uncharacterized OsmC-like protein